VTASKSKRIVGVEAYHSRSYDRAAPKVSINQTEHRTGVRPKESFVDRGDRCKEPHLEDIKVHITRERKARGY